MGHNGTRIGCPFSTFDICTRLIVSRHCNAKKTKICDVPHSVQTQFSICQTTLMGVFLMLQVLGFLEVIKSYVGAHGVQWNKDTVPVFYFRHMYRLDCLPAMQCNKNQNWPCYAQAWCTYTSWYTVPSPNGAQYLRATFCNIFGDLAAPFEPLLLSQSLQNRLQLATLRHSPAHLGLVHSKERPTVPKHLPCMPSRCTWVTIDTVPVFNFRQMYTLDCFLAL